MSGYLWRSDVLFYDRESKTFWSQIAARAVVGPLTGTALKALPAHVSTWADFRARHPEGKVLLPGGVEGLEPAFYRQRPYYAAYRADDTLRFGAVLLDKRLRAKEEVLGVVVDGQAHAWSLPFLRAATGEVRAEVGGKPFVVRYHRASDRAEVFDERGGPVVSLRAYWFAWTLFHPETTLTS